MIWNSSQWIRPESSGGALIDLLFLVLVLKLKNLILPWRLAELHRPSPKQTQRGAAAQRHIHNTLREALEFGWLLISICFLFIVISHIKVYQAHVLHQWFYINHTWLKDGNFTSPLTCTELLSDSAYSNSSEAHMWVEDFLKYEDDSYTGHAELQSNLHQ